MGLGRLGRQFPRAYALGYDRARGAVYCEKFGLVWRQPIETPSFIMMYRMIEGWEGSLRIRD